MAHIKSSIKRIRLQEKAATRNKSKRSLLKTNVKKFETAISEGDLDNAQAAFRVAVKTVDRAATKGLIHKNKAARRKSKMARKLNKI